jgi:hypothetical protein
MLHCVLLARVYPTPDISRPISFLPLVYEPGIYKFFLCQGLGVIIEKIVLGDPKREEIPAKKVLRIFFLYFVLLMSGRYCTNALAVKGLLDKDQWNTVTIPAIAKMVYAIFTQ